MRAQASARWAAASAAALLMAVSAAASAAPVGRTTAQATFVSQDARGCVSTEVTIFVRGTPGNARLRLSVAKVDECKDVMLLSARTTASLSGGAFRVRPDLGTATLTTTVPLVDKASREERTATIRVTWTAVEEAVSAVTPVEEEESGRFVRQAALRSFRPAKAAGLVTMDGAELTPRLATDASLAVTR